MLLAADNPGGGFDITTILIIAALFAAMYFFMIRPQQKRRREVETMQKAMGVGDEVMTGSGLYGVIDSLDDSTVLLEIAPEVVVKVARAAVMQVVTSAGQVDEDAFADNELVADEPLTTADVVDEAGSTATPPSTKRDSD